ncbi:hypothetical protein ISCGN_015507 [Ixodes scapularis]
MKVACILVIAALLLTVARASEELCGLPDEIKETTVKCITEHVSPQDASLAGVFTASKKVLPRFKSDDVKEVLRSRRPRSWRCISGGGGSGRYLSCFRSLSSVAVHGSFGGQELGRRDDSDTPVGCFLQEILLPTARIATSDSMTLRLSLGHFWPLRDHFRCMGRIGR